MRVRTCCCSQGGTQGRGAPRVRELESRGSHLLLDFCASELQSLDSGSPAQDVCYPQGPRKCVFTEGIINDEAELRGIHCLG